MSWPEAFARRYEEWSAPMTADIAFYVELAREANGPLVELAIGNGRVAIPVAQATGSEVIGVDGDRRRRQCWIRRELGRPRPAWRWTCAWATCAS